MSWIEKLVDTIRRRYGLFGILLGLAIFIAACSELFAPPEINLEEISWEMFRNEAFGYEVQIPSYVEIPECEHCESVSFDLNPRGISPLQRVERERSLSISYDPLSEFGCVNKGWCVPPWEIYTCTSPGVIFPGEMVEIADKLFLKKVSPYKSCIAESCTFWMSYSEVGSSGCITLFLSITEPWSSPFPTPTGVDFHYQEEALLETIVSSLVWDE